MQKAPRGAGLRACSCSHEQVSASNFGGDEKIRTSDPGFAQMLP